MKFEFNRNAIAIAVLVFFGACEPEPLPDDAIDASIPSPGYVEICGNGIVGAAEHCDDGFTDACGACNADCTAPGDGATCGDGFICPQYEECDDGDTDSDDGCSSDCVLESGWQCAETPSICIHCGDGIVQEHEECDDGNSSRGDGCSDNCKIECPEGWYDVTTDLCWQGNPLTSNTWEASRSYCDSLSLGDASDWRLPTVDELRSLVRDCGATEIGGACDVTEGAGTGDWDSSCDGCAEQNGPSPGGCYWESSLDLNPPDVQHGACGDNFWSSSTNSEFTDFAWIVSFSKALVDSGAKQFSNAVRCVRDGP